MGLKKKSPVKVMVTTIAKICGTETNFHVKEMVNVSVITRPAVRCYLLTTYARRVIDTFSLCFVFSSPSQYRDCSLKFYPFTIFL